MIVGAACGAVIGLALLIPGVGGGAGGFEPGILMMAALFLVGLGVSLGGLAGGFVGPTGWRMIGGAALGWFFVGGLSARSLHHITTGVFYGALYGPPLGAFLGLFCGLYIEARSSAKTSAPHPTAGVWDRELDE